MWEKLNSLWHNTKWKILDLSAQKEEVFATELHEPNLPSWRPSRDTRQLHPYFRGLLSHLLNDLHNDGIALYVFEARRSFKRQKYLYEQGRQRLYDFKGNRLKVVTNAIPGHSMHNYGLAADLVFDGDVSSPGTQWSWGGDYSKLRPYIDKYPGIEWAGDWTKFREYPHIQLKTTYSTRALHGMYTSKGEGVSGMRYVWDIINYSRVSDFGENV